MNKVLALVLVCTISLSGCVTREAKRVSRESNAMSTMYVSKMKNGTTTPEQDKEFIESASNVFLQLDRAVRGTKQAEQTRKESEILSGGVNSKGPLNLDK